HLFTTFPDQIPPVLIVQHIPAGFSKAFADRLNTLYPFEIREAADGDFVKPNLVLIAPGDFHMRLHKSAAGIIVKLDQAEPVNGHRPSADCLMESAAKIYEKKCKGVILTGMGNDGAKGLMQMKDSGAFTVGQNEESSVVYGMPKAAFEMGATCSVADL
ncbi:MAG: chemotaxis protein CheB, partial [Bdellovibrionales bacterium]|nr:chemotaxis protein CheB [Bdellovibrionales bacterium]